MKRGAGFAIVAATVLIAGPAAANEGDVQAVFVYSGEKLHALSISAAMGDSASGERFVIQTENGPVFGTAAAATGAGGQTRTSVIEGCDADPVEHCEINAFTSPVGQ